MSLQRLFRTWAGVCSRRSPFQGAVSLEFINPVTPDRSRSRRGSRNRRSFAISAAAFNFRFRDNFLRKEPTHMEAWMRRPVLTVVVCAILLVTTRTFEAHRGTTDGQWANHSGDKGSTKYAALDQINRNNV